LQNPSNFGQPVQFTATVSSATGTPTGTITFKDGVKTLGKVPLAGNSANFSTANLQPGIHIISAIYSGDSNHNDSSDTQMQTVKKITLTTTLSSSANPSTHGQSVTFTAKFIPASVDAGFPTGRVVFKDGSAILGTASLNASGTATYSTSSLSRGTHNITAIYSGDDQFTESTSPALSQKVN
jgi:hypothetical protein